MMGLLLEQPPGLPIHPKYPGVNRVNRKTITEAAKMFTFYQEELSTHNDVLLKGDRIVVPIKLRRKILGNIHRSHMGIETTKQRTRTSVFWPGINTEVEEIVRKCNACSSTEQQQQKERLLTSDTYPWQSVGTDLFEWNGQHFVIVVDYNSR